MPQTTISACAGAQNIARIPKAAARMGCDVRGKGAPGQGRALLAALFLDWFRAKFFPPVLKFAWLYAVDVDADLRAP